MPDEDHALVEGLRAAEPAAFDALYERYRARTFGFLVRLTKNRAMAEDLLQETWLRAARHAHRLTPDSRPGPWLFRIGYNLFVSHQRWAALDLERIGQFRWTAGEDHTPSTPFDLRSATELQRRLELALIALPLKHREVLSLVAIEGLEPIQAARVLDLSPEAVRQRLKRARDALADALTEEERLAVGRT